MKEHEKKFLHAQTLRQVLEINSTRYALRKAFLLTDKNGELYHISYRQFFGDTMHLAASLIKNCGLFEKKVAVCLPNCYEWCVSYFAVCSGVGVTVPLEYGMITEELLNVIEFAEIGAIIADSVVTARLLENYDRLPPDFQIITTDYCGDKRTTDYYTLLSQGKELIDSKAIDIFSIPVDPDKLAVLLFTSGTTGMAKGVMLSNRNILSDMIGVSEVCVLDYNDSTLCTLPLHHTYQAIVMLMMIYMGGCVSFSRNIRHVAKDMQTFKPTIFASVPLLLEKTHTKIIKNLNEQNVFKKSITVGKVSSLINKLPGEEMKKHIYSGIHEAFGGRLRMIITGAAAINEDIARDYKAFGFSFIIGYGLTECSPIAICNSSADPRYDGIGKPIGDAEVKIENKADDGIGEICVKGPMVMLGYYNAPEETQKVLKDGWLHTGDLGCKDEEGFYHITGRSKNVIVTKNGKNVYPEELEYYLNKDPLVLESLIFSDEDENEQVSAAVVPNEEAIKSELQKEKLSKEDIHNAIAQVVKKINRHLPSYKSIRKFNISENELEKTSTSKIKRGSVKNDKKEKGNLKENEEQG